MISGGTSTFLPVGDSPTLSPIFGSASVWRTRFPTMAIIPSWQVGNTLPLAGDTTTAGDRARTQAPTSLVLLVVAFVVVLLFTSK